MTPPPDPLCADCGGAMRVVEVRHKTRRRTYTPICPTCLTSRPRREETKIRTPPLQIVRTSA